MDWSFLAGVIVGAFSVWFNLWLRSHD